MTPNYHGRKFNISKKFNPKIYKFKYENMQYLEFQVKTHNVFR